MCLIRRMLAMIVMCLLAVVIGVLAVEGIVRMLNLVVVTDYRPIADSTDRYRMRPLATMTDVQPEYQVPIAINNAGFRDKPFDLSKRPGLLRIAAIGDSFTFGTGVAQTARATEEVERGLRERGIGCEVYNFGMPDTETATQVSILREHVMPYQPDYLLIMLYVGNDIVDNARLAGGAPKGYDSAERSLTGWMLDQIRLHSRLYQVALTRVAGSPAARALYNQVKTGGHWGEVGNQMRLFAA